MALIPPGMADDVVAARYARWLATTPHARAPDTRQRLADELGVTIAHLEALHNAPWWHDYVEHLCGTWTPGFSQATTDRVLEALAAKAEKGDVPAATLWLKMAGVIPWQGGRAAKVVEAEEVDATSIPTAQLEQMYEGDGG